MSRGSPSRASHKLMGYQLLILALCVVVAELVTPKYGLVLAASIATSGGSGFFHAVQTPPTVVVQTGAMPLGSMARFPLRSAGSCNRRIAFGLMGFVPGAVGGVTPRANPSFSHSNVTGFQFPDTSLYSTRR